jgi:hypothetical protein
MTPMYRERLDILNVCVELSEVCYCPRDYDSNSTTQFASLNTQ